MKIPKTNTTIVAAAVLGLALGGMSAELLLPPLP